MYYSILIQILHWQYKCCLKHCTALTVIMANQLISNISKLFILTTILFTSTTLTLIGAAAKSTNLRQACRVTRYHGLCVRTLAPFSGTSSTTTPTRWARAGVSVATAETKSAARYVAALLRRRRRDREALSDCAECLAEAVAGLQESLGVLRRGAATSAERAGDLATWLSASLTDSDTCLEGFRGRRGKRARILRARVSGAGRLISNALALVNALLN